MQEKHRKKEIKTKLSQVTGPRARLLPNFSLMKNTAFRMENK